MLDFEGREQFRVPHLGERPDQASGALVQISDREISNLLAEGAGTPIRDELLVGDANDQRLLSSQREHLALNLSVRRSPFALRAADSGHTSSSASQTRSLGLRAQAARRNAHPALCGTSPSLHLSYLGRRSDRRIDSDQCADCRSGQTSRSAREPGPPRPILSPGGEESK